MKLQLKSWVRSLLQCLGMLVIMMSLVPCMWAHATGARFDSGKVPWTPQEQAEYLGIAFVLFALGFSALWVGFRAKQPQDR